MRSLWHGKGLGLYPLGNSSGPVQAEERPVSSPKLFRNLDASVPSPKSPFFPPGTDGMSPTPTNLHDPTTDPFDVTQLPFSPARQKTKLFCQTNEANTSFGSLQGHSDNRSTLSSAEPSPAFSSLFGSSPTKAKVESDKSSVSSQFTAPGDDMLMEILSSQAMIESKGFEVLSWNELEALKMEHKSVTSRMTALQYKLNLEIKMRDAALLMERPDLGASLDSRSQSRTTTMSSIKMPRSESHENRLESASTNIASVTADLSRLQQQESELRTKLLRHMAGVLSYVLTKRDVQQNAHELATPTLSRQLYKFEGPHFFAGSQDATKPRPGHRRSFSRSVPVSGSNRNESSVEAALTSELQQRLDQLQAAHEAALASLQDSRQEHENLRQELESAGDTADRLEQDHRGLQSAHEELSQRHTSTSSEVESLRKQLDKVHQSKNEVESQLEATEANLRALESSSKGESGALSKRLNELEDSLRRAEEEKQQAQRTVAEYEAQLATERNLASERCQLTNNFKASINDLAKKYELPPLPAARSQPNADEHATLLYWIDSQLSQGKSRAADMSIIQSRIQELQTQLASKQRDLEEAQSGLEKATSSSTTLQRNLDQQKELLGSHESSVALVPKLRNELAALESKVASITSERDVARGHLADAGQSQELQRAEASKRDAALQELWKLLPAQRDAGKLGESDDLSLWKKAFSNQGSASRLPILRSNSTTTAPSKYSFETLCERIKNMVSDDKQLVERLIKHESSVKSSSTSLQTLQSSLRDMERSLKEKESALAEAQKEVADLQAYVQSSAAKQADMLERLNEAQQQAESVRSEKRRLEASTSSASNARIAELEAALGDAERSSAQLLAGEHGRKASLENQVQAANSEIQDLRDALHDAQEELEESREREHKGRMQLMDEVSKLGREVSSLRSQLRQEQRKAAKQAQGETTPTGRS